MNDENKLLYSINTYIKQRKFDNISYTGFKNIIWNGLLDKKLQEGLKIAFRFNSFSIVLGNACEHAIVELIKEKGTYKENYKKIFINNKEKHIDVPFLNKTGRLCLYELKANSMFDTQKGPSIKNALTKLKTTFKKAKVKVVCLDVQNVDDSNSLLKYCSKNDIISAQDFFKDANIKVSWKKWKNIIITATENWLLNNGYGVKI